MDWFTGSVVYFLAWWTVLFAVLPWGNAPAENPGEGHEQGAPANPRLKLKFLITTVITAIIWLIIYFMIKFDVLDFYQAAEQMIKEDNL